MFMRHWQYNAPTLAYEIAHGKKPKTPIRGMSFSPKKQWKGIYVDADFKDKWLEDINSIPYISIRSTEVGKSALRPAHIAFTFADPKLNKYASQLVQKLHQLGVKAKVATGQCGARIIIAEPVWKGKKGWTTFWNTIGDKIRLALARTMKEGKMKLSELSNPKILYPLLIALGIGTGTIGEHARFKKQKRKEEIEFLRNMLRKNGQIKTAGLPVNKILKGIAAFTAGGAAGAVPTYFIEKGVEKKKERDLSHALQLFSSGYKLGYLKAVDEIRRRKLYTG